MPRIIRKSNSSLLFLLIAVIILWIMSLSIYHDWYKKEANLEKKKYSVNYGILNKKLSDISEKYSNLKRELEFNKNLVKTCLEDWAYKNSSRVSKKFINKVVSKSLEKTNPYLILAIIAEESSFNPTVTSSVGAVGLGQVMPKVWTKELTSKNIITEPRDLFDPLVNIEAMEYILLKYYKQYQDWDKVLNAYVGGDKSYVRRVKENIGEMVLDCKWREYYERSNDLHKRNPRSKRDTETKTTDCEKKPQSKSQSQEH